MRKYLHVIVTLLFLISVPSITTAIEERQFAVNMDQTTFEKSIATLGEIFDMKIIFMGNSVLPQHKFSFTLGQATFEEATAEALRKAGIQNHVLAWDQQTKTARIWILPAGKTISISSLAGYSNSMKTITPKGVNDADAAGSENFGMLTKTEFARLEPESNQKDRGMTPGEFAKLKP